jgi:citrate synthase
MGKTALPPLPESDYVTRAQAITLLGIKAATLYTYVSRGWIRRVPHADNKQSLYFKEDIEKIRARSDARRQEGVVAAGAMQYGGEPVIPTAITELTPSGQRYRNRSAIDLAKGGIPFESTAELLWSGIWIDEPIVWKIEPLPSEFLQLANSLRTLRPQANIHEIFSIMTLALGKSRGSLSDRIRHGSTAILSARQLIQAMTGCLGFLSKKQAYRPPRDGESIAQALARSLGLAPAREVLQLLNAALTLSADHELNPAALTARIAASSEADIHSCIAAAICTHSGERTAKACDRLEDFFSSATTRSQLLKKMTVLEKTAHPIPGFNHPLYPKGDPRAICLLEIIKQTLPHTRQLGEIYRFLDEAAARLHAYPRIKVAIVIMAIALDLPAGSAAGIYTFGRTAGWVAHVMEQRLSGFLIRPRAKYLSGLSPAS